MPLLSWLNTTNPMTRFKWESEGSTTTSRHAQAVSQGPLMSNRITRAERKNSWRPMSDSSSSRCLRGTARRDSKERSPSTRNNVAEKRKRSNVKETWRRSDRNISRSRRNSWRRSWARSRKRCSWSRRKSSLRRRRRESCARKRR